MGNTITAEEATATSKLGEGRRLNEIPYTVQLIDNRRHLVSLTKADLREYTVLKSTSDAFLQR